ncbi:DUF427 domain-containing protein [Plantibacter sp. Mn2098]|uniref:DUF427 domain-containing protein n=1 Tax=Plantibacter sp. Mn2098 TaxID=3395266 RepID=UPI003BCE397D
MRASLNGNVIAEAPDEDLIKIEGNWYFPPSSIVEGALAESPTPYTCPWKGVCQYFDVSVGGEVAKDHAWSYPNPYDGAAERVGKEFANYVAFDPRVTVGA